MVGQSSGAGTVEKKRLATGWVVVLTLFIVGSLAGAAVLVMVVMDRDDTPSAVRCDTVWEERAAKQEGQRCTSSPPAPLPDPVEDRQLDQIRGYFDDYSAAEHRLFCETWISQELGRWPNTGTAISMFIQGYGQASGASLRPAAADYLRDELESCLRTYG